MASFFREEFYAVARIRNQRYASHQPLGFRGFVMQDFPQPGTGSNYAFKPTAVGVFRSNLLLPCGGGLTRR